MSPWLKRAGWALLTGGVLLAAVCIWLFYDLPSSEIRETQLRMPSIRITDRNGQVLYEVMASDSGRQLRVSLEQIPETLRQASITTEDARFYSNPGVDLPGLLRAVWINLSGGETLSGGSTITQQVVRNLLLSAEERNERSIRRKLREMVLAWQLTRRYSKDEILAFYLNQTYYGGMTYGVEAAAQTYFGKDLQELSLAECALLAGLPQAPALYNPYTDLEAAMRRRSVVLALMEKNGDISAQQRSQAENESIRLSAAPYPLEAPHFVMMVRASIDSLFSPEEIRAGGGLVVRTTLNLSWQHTAERAVTTQLERLRLAGEINDSHNVNNAAVVVLDPHTGQIMALVGSPDFYDRRHNGAINMAVSPRQPGSALKPFIYALAMSPEQAQPWTAATMLLDVSTHFQTRDGKVYSPANFDRQEHGPVRLRQALASSLNIPAVFALNHVGISEQFAFLRRLGIDDLGRPQDYDVSLALGGGEISLLNLSTAYAVLANEGQRVQPYAILEVQDGLGRERYRAPKTAVEQVMDARLAWLISDILSDDVARSIGFPANSVLNIGRPAAVKTGTTTNFHDNWAMGYTPDLTVGVWVGNAGQEPMHDVTGLSGAGPIWHAIIRELTAGQPAAPFERPPGLREVQVCSPSGLLPTPDCSDRIWEWFMEGTVPQQPDTLYRRVRIDRRTGELAGENTPSAHILETTAWDLPLEAAAWAHRQGVLLWADLQQQTDAVFTPQAQSARIKVISPAEGALYVFSNKLPAESQQVRIEAVPDGKVQRVNLYVDDVLLAEVAQYPYQAWWSLTPGDHRFSATAVGADGALLNSPAVSIHVMQE